MKKPGYTYITPRTLLGIIRLAQGLARLRFNEFVQRDDIDEAIRLTEVSRSTTNDDETKFDTFSTKNDVTSNIMNIIKELCTNKDRTTTIDEIQKRLIYHGLDNTKLENVLSEYENLGVIFLNSKRNEITMI